MHGWERTAAGLGYQLGISHRLPSPSGSIKLPAVASWERRIFHLAQQSTSRYCQASAKTITRLRSHFFSS